MSVNLVKGQKVSLTKEKLGLSRVMVGLGWDEAQRRRGLFAPKPEPIDCDAIAFLLNAEGRIETRKDVVFFNNLRHESGCVNHQGDNLTGEGNGDDEQIMVDLKHLPEKYQRVIILVSIYKATDRRQHFGMIKNAFIRIVDTETGKELCIYNLSEDYEGGTAMVFGELYRENGEWKFNAAGQPLRIWTVSDLAAQYGLSKEVWR